MDVYHRRYHRLLSESGSIAAIFQSCKIQPGQCRLTIAGGTRKPNDMKTVALQVDTSICIFCTLLRCFPNTVWSSCLGPRQRWSCVAPARKTLSVPSGVQRQLAISVPRELDVNNHLWRGGTAKSGTPKTSRLLTTIGGSRISDGGRATGLRRPAGPGCATFRRRNVSDGLQILSWGYRYLHPGEWGGGWGKITFQGTSIF